MEPTAGSSCPVQECVRYQSVFEPSGARGPVAPATPASGPPITTTAATAPRRGPDPGNDGPRPAVPAPGPGRPREPARRGETACPGGLWGRWGRWDRWGRWWWGRWGRWWWGRWGRWWWGRWGRWWG